MHGQFCKWKQVDTSSRWANVKILYRIKPKQNTQQCLLTEKFLEREKKKGWESISYTFVKYSLF